MRASAEHLTDGIPFDVDSLWGRKAPPALTGPQDDGPPKMTLVNRILRANGYRSLPRHWAWRVVPCTVSERQRERFVTGFPPGATP